MFKSSNFDIQSQIEELFLHNLGWKISLDNKYSDKKIENICKKMGFEEISELILSFQDNRYSEKLIQTLAHEFSIGESYFFRDKKFFNILENKIIPQLLKEKNINIWSVGCSSGEEAYSVAMMLDKNIPNISEWNIFILGTDINIDFLSKAKRGVYTNHSLHNMPQYYKEKYFKKLDNKYEISPLIKKNVHFEYHNIANKTPPLLYENRVFDLILLKNILIYFDKEKAKEVVDFLYTNIKTGRWLSTTPVEYSSDIFNSYQAKNFSEESMILKSAVPDIKSLSQLPLLQTDDNIDSYLDIVKIFQPYKQSVQDEKICKILESSIENKFFNNEPFKHYQKACELLETGEVQEAKKHLRKCLYVDNNFLVGLISFGNIFKKEDDNENFSRYINRAKELLYKMEPHTIVDFSDGMTVDELLGMINHEKISDEGVVNANS